MVYQGTSSTSNQISISITITQTFIRQSWIVSATKHMAFYKHGPPRPATLNGISMRGHTTSSCPFSSPLQWFSTKNKCSYEPMLLQIASSGVHFYQKHRPFRLAICEALAGSSSSVDSTQKNKPHLWWVYDKVPSLASGKVTPLF